MIRKIEYQLISISPRAYVSLIFKNAKYIVFGVFDELKLLIVRVISSYKSFRRRIWRAYDGNI
ncbi:hypothetical protein, partial [Aquimarina sp. I32.4]|uniref:hypothetical protein n=1 Tax=Aquimarina sp. I32.4 TaxID=2053903 RepID=UPI001E43D6A4